MNAQRIAVVELSHRHAFTLIELTVVLALAALIVTVAVVKLHEPYRKARLEGTLERIMLFERQVRNYAIGHNRAGILRIDTRPSTLEFVISDRNPDSLRFPLDDELTIDRIFTADGKSSHTRAEIHMSGGGTTSSYALSVQDAAGERRWLLFLGITGQVIKIDEERRFHELRDSLLEVQRVNAR
jgi:prepilin-type N-terminal cleavage/methylation domain-containing protein